MPFGIDILDGFRVEEIGFKEEVSLWKRACIRSQKRARPPGIVKRFPLWHPFFCACTWGQTADREEQSNSGDENFRIHRRSSVAAVNLAGDGAHARINTPFRGCLRELERDLHVRSIW